MDKLWADIPSLTGASHSLFDYLSAHGGIPSCSGRRAGSVAFKLLMAIRYHAVRWSEGYKNRAAWNRIARVSRGRHGVESGPAIVGDELNEE